MAVLKPKWALMHFRDDAQISVLEVVLRDADGDIIGTWNATNPHAAHAALHASQLKKVDTVP